MRVPPELQIQYAPAPGGNYESEEERTVIFSVHGYLELIRSSATEVVAGIALYQFCVPHMRERDLRWDWAFMGARAGALGLRNFGQALAKLRKLPGMVKSWRESDADFGKLAEVETDFNTLFPGADRLRHSVAHPEFYADPTKPMKAGSPVLKPGVQLGENTTIKGSIFGNKFVATFEGSTLEYELSSETSLAMREFTDRIYEVFGPLDWSWRLERSLPPR